MRKRGDQPKLFFNMLVFEKNLQKHECEYTCENIEFFI